MTIEINKNFCSLEDNYLFSKIRAKKRDYEEKHPDQIIINLGVGDVIGALTESAINALKSGIEAYKSVENFKGYPPEQGYPFLREKIVNYYKKFNVNLDIDSIFISDGAKSDLSNIIEIFSDLTALIPTPVYPVYVDTNIIKGNKIKYLECIPENNFLPLPNKQLKGSYLIYLCSPNNPTGAVFSYEDLKKWVDFANSTGSIIIFDSAYEAFIRSGVPHSIFEIEGSENCSIEIASFSKRAGFTGLRLGYTIINRKSKRMNEFALCWARRQATEFNGVSYLIQKAGEATLTEIGLAECQSKIDYYLKNAEIIKKVFIDKGFNVYGGTDSPYIWIDCKKDSWEFFDEMLEKYQIVGTAGAGFGKGGEHFYRLSAFALRKDILLAVNRLKK